MLEKILNWFKDVYQSTADWFNEILDAILNWFEALPLKIYSYFLEGTLELFNTFQPPQFIQDGLQSMVSALPSDIGYFLAMSGLAQGLSIYGTAVVYKFLRRLMPF